MRSLRASDWRDFLRAEVALARAAILLRTRRRGSLVSPAAAAALAGSRLDVPAPIAPAPAGRSTEEAATRDSDHRDAGQQERARRIAISVRRAARYGILRPSCLVRAIALRRLLDAEGIEGASVRVGVRRVDGEFSAHAWVTYGGRVIGEPQAFVERFNELTDIEVRR